MVRCFCFTGADQSKDFGRIINSRHVARIRRILAQSSGGQVVVGGESSINPDKCFVPPTVVLDPSLDDVVMREEIFGFVLLACFDCSLRPILWFDVPMYACSGVALSSRLSASTVSMRPSASLTTYVSVAVAPPLLSTHCSCDGPCRFVPDHWLCTCSRKATKRNVVFW